MEIDRHQRERMTYQLALAGRDGIVLASDRCERQVSYDEKYGVKNMVRKIWLDRSSRYAWCCAGSEAGPFFADQIRKSFDPLADGFSEEDALKAFEQAAIVFVEEFSRRYASGPWGCSVLLVSGPSRRMFRRKHFPPTQEMLGGFCVNGAEFNLSAYLPSRLYSVDLPTSDLVYLAAYSVRAATTLRALWWMDSILRSTEIRRISSNF